MNIDHLLACNLCTNLYSRMSLCKTRFYAIFICFKVNAKRENMRLLDFIVIKGIKSRDLL